MTLKAHKITEETKKRDKELLRVASKALPCSQCNRIVERCSGTCSSVICPRCVQNMIDPPDVVLKIKPEEKRPQGWHLKKEYTSPSGKVYNFGVEIDENSKPNTELDTTKIVVKKKRGRPKKVTNT